MIDTNRTCATPSSGTTKIHIHLYIDDMMKALTWNVFDIFYALNVPSNKKLY